METIYLQDNLKAVVKLERLSDDDADIGHSSTMRKKMGEIFQTSRDHLAFVCIHCAAEFPLFIQFSSHIEKHLQEIHSNSIKPAATAFSTNSDIHHIDIKALKYETESDGETANFDDDIEEIVNNSDSHPTNSNTSAHIGGENNAANINQLNDREEKPLNAGDTTENITEDDEISKQIDDESDTQISQPVKVSSRKNTSNNENIKIFECFECHRRFNTINSRRNCRIHTRLHSTTSKKCNCCTRPVLIGLPIECLFCSESFTQLNFYSKHGNKCNKLTEEQLKLLRQMCKPCSMEFKSKSIDEKQMKLDEMVKRHNELNKKCKFCCRVFLRVETLKRHMERHEGSGKFTCEICNQSYGLNYKSSHMRTHTGERKHQCSECGLLCFNMSRLHRHMMIHTNERPYECDYCHKFFRKRCTLKAHRRVHTGEYVHFCESCKKGYTEINGLRKHNLKVHGFQMERKKKKNILIT